MDLILIGAVIGFIASWAVFRRENWRLEDKLDEKQAQIDNLLRREISSAVGSGEQKCSSKQSDYFIQW